MEKKLQIASTEDSPEIIFDVEKNILLISGRSLPEDAFNFYAPILKWMKEYINEPNQNSELILNLDYFNSSSVKQIMRLFTIFEELGASGKDAKIIWKYSLSDDLMEIKGQEFKSMITKVPFELVKIVED